MECKASDSIIFLLTLIGTINNSSFASSSFNCVEAGENAITGNLFTKTTEQAFQFDIVATKNGNTIDTDFANDTNHTVTVELVDANSGGTCASYVPLSPVASHNLIFIASDSGKKLSADLSSSSAVKAAKCRVTDTTNTPTTVGCSTDSFAIRPTTLLITSNLTNSTSTGLPKAKAGEYFTLIASTANNYNGTPEINPLINVQPHTGATRSGTVSGIFDPATTNAATGTATATGIAFNYSAVGSFRFLSQGIIDESFTAIDQPNDCLDNFSNIVTSSKVGCKFGNTVESNYFGRFTPDHFEVTLNTPEFNPSCGTFTYFDQPIKYRSNPVVSIIAKNRLNITAENYTGAFWKIDPTSPSFSPIYTESGHTLTVLEDGKPTAIDNGDGTGSLTFANASDNILLVTKNTLTAPTEIDIALSFSLIDTDGVVVNKVNSVTQSNPIVFGTASAGNGIAFYLNNKGHRWGRFSLNNTHGSELTPLHVPLHTEYYNGNRFVKNTADNCTTLSIAGNFSISDTHDVDCSLATQSTPVSIGSGSVKATLTHATVTKGITTLLISDNINLLQGSGAGNTGYVDITTQLSNLPWLRYDWNGAGTHDKCPSARATFGIYRGNSNQIYFREVY